MTDITIMNQKERDTFLEQTMDDLILKIMMNLNDRGFTKSEILAALEDVCDMRHLEYQEDPDPADDHHGEVSN